MSFYVTAAAGNLRLGLYDATGPGGGPGTKIAETAQITPVVGWNTANVTLPVSIPAGTYWLAYVPSSNGLGFRNAQTGSNRYYSFPYGALPATFSTAPNSGTFHFSFYATLSPGSGGGGAIPTVTGVSRATASKYVMLPNGHVVPFSDFFTAALNVKDVIRDVIEHETAPLADQDIMEKLQEYGHYIARRTVAKYREELGILPSHQRRLAPRKR